MAEKKPTGGQAFPSEASIHPLATNGGMTLRDYFAGQVAAGLAAYPGNLREGNEPRHFAQWAYAIADAMLKERDRG